MDNKNVFSLLNIEYLDDINLANMNIPSLIIEKLDEKFLRDNKVVPYIIDDNLLTILISTPENIKVVTQLKFLLNKENHLLKDH